MPIITHGHKTVSYFGGRRKVLKSTCLYPEHEESVKLRRLF